MMTETQEVIAARAHMVAHNELAQAFCSLYQSFLDGCTREQCVGILTHRGLTTGEARRVFEIQNGLTA